MVKIVTVFASANLDQIRLVPAVTAPESLHFGGPPFFQTCAHREKEVCCTRERQIVFVPLCAAFGWVGIFRITD